MCAPCEGGTVCWGEVCRCDGDGGGEEVGVDVGVTKSSELARECVLGEDMVSCSDSGARLPFSLWFTISLTPCPTPPPPVDYNKGKNSILYMTCTYMYTR